MPDKTRRQCQAPHQAATLTSGARYEGKQPAHSSLIKPKGEGTSANSVVGMTAGPWEPGVGPGEEQAWREGLHQKHFRAARRGRRRQRANQHLCTTTTPVGLELLKHPLGGPRDL